MGYDVTGPQVHADGEIWSATNFRIRQLLIDKYDDDFPADDRTSSTRAPTASWPPYACPGNRRWFQLYYDAMLLMPTTPSMLQARDAILAADLMRFGGANQKELWLGFARSGYGVRVHAAATRRRTRTSIRRRASVAPGTTTRRSRSARRTRTARRSQRSDLRRSLRGPRLADRRHQSGDDGPEPRRHGRVRAWNVRARREAPGYGPLRGRKTFYKGEDSMHRVQVRARTMPRRPRALTATGDGTASWPT